MHTSTTLQIRLHKSHAMAPAIVPKAPSPLKLCPKIVESRPPCAPVRLHRLKRQSQVGSLPPRLASWLGSSDITFYEYP